MLRLKAAAGRTLENWKVGVLAVSCVASPSCRSVSSARYCGVVLSAAQCQVLRSVVT